MNRCNILVLNVKCDYSHKGLIFNMAKSVKERKKEQRERDDKLDIKQVNIRVHIDDEEAVKNHAQALLEKKLNKQLAIVTSHSILISQSSE